MLYDNAKKRKIPMVYLKKTRFNGFLVEVGMEHPDLSIIEPKRISMEKHS